MRGRRVAASPGLWTLGRLGFLGDRLLTALAVEARAQCPGEVAAGRPQVGAAGDALARLAVSRQLREAVSAANGMPLTATYEAVYQYQPPGSAVGPHRDGAGYDFVFHLTVEHVAPSDGSAGSVLEVQGTTVTLPVGHGVLLRGGDTTHRWTRLGAGEHRTLIAVGFRPAAITP